ncbi:MAG: hypothetical protein GQ546_14935 [Gammaproteobacteria bacterium]|nr:hypothetical protein [Gammaproteobacteria bacterium]
MIFIRRNLQGLFRQFFLLLTLFACLFNSSVIFAGEDDIRRRVAFKLFRATLAADTNIEQKASHGELIIILLYSGNTFYDRIRANNFVEQLKKNNSFKNIRNKPVKIKLFSEQAFLNESKSKKIVSNLAGIYLLDELPETAIHAIIRQATKYQIITYSPFKGDVERGVLGGLSVEAKVRPYINMKTLRESKILLKPFFMKVIKYYEP